MKKQQAIYIIWEDAVMKDEAWSDMKDIEEWSEKTNGRIHQIGVVLKETKEFIILASRWDDLDDPMYGFVHKIPKTWVRKRVNLTI